MWRCYYIPTETKQRNQLKVSEMNISNTAIIKSESPYAAIQEAIKGFFNELAADNFLEGIALVDGVAESVRVDVQPSGAEVTTIDYFIPTIINSSLIRVDHCYSSTIVWNN